MSTQRLLKPAEYAENQIVDDILNARYLPGDALPAERMLAQELGITRPTLRETLQRLSREGWVTIRHGKPTRVNDYLENGGLAILNALVRHGRQLPQEMVEHLLEVRAGMLPVIAQKAAQNDPHALLSLLEQTPDLTDSAQVWADFDWNLQMQMVKACGNPVFNMIFNDFTPLYEMLGQKYFSLSQARSASLSYYRDLSAELTKDPPSVEVIVEKIMGQVREIWPKTQ